MKEESDDEIFARVVRESAKNIREQIRLGYMEYVGNDLRLTEAGATRSELEGKSLRLVKENQ